jgi:hypothetical protein
MSDEDNKLFQTFGGRNKAIFVIVALLVAIGFFIAGAVMLGVGIHKANTKAATCPSDKVTTTAPSVPNKSSTTPKKPARDVKPKPFYLTVLNTKVTGDNLDGDFPGSARSFRDMVICYINK